MTGDPFHDLLGIDESDPPHIVLGLSRPEGDVAAIYAALYRRLADVHRHPQGHTKPADFVRRRLRTSARLLVSAAMYREGGAHSGDGGGGGGAAHSGGESGDVFRIFLRVADFADPIEVLGLEDRVPDRATIDVALMRRLIEVDRNVHASAPEAEHARRVLRAAAALLTDPALSAAIIEMRAEPVRPEAMFEPSPPHAPPPQRARAAAVPPTRARSLAPAVAAPPLPRPPARDVGAAALLTPFDRQVLAVLIGCGGWNSTSRSLLVALAEAYHVAPDGLVKVIKGLSDYARSHRSRLGVHEITQGMEAPSGNGQTDTGGAIAAGPVPQPAAVSPDAADERGAGFWTPVTVSLLASIITIVIGLAVLALVLPGVLDGGAPDRAATGDAALPPDASTPGPKTAAGDGASPAGPPRLAHALRVPTFLGNGLPMAGADAADASVTLEADFDDIERKLSLTDDPSEAVFRAWDDLVNQFASGWVLMDEALRRRAEQSMLEALAVAADAPTVSDRLLASLTPVSSPFPEPIDVWRGAWKTRLLGRIAGLQTMAPVVVDKARRQLDAALAVRIDADRRDPNQLARQWLARAAVSLIDSVEYEPRAYDFWELWVAAQRELGPGEQHELALLEAVRAIARGTVDLARPGPSASIVGRLLGLVDFTAGRAVRDALLALYDDPAITSRDLWVITSILAQRAGLSWFTEDLVVPDGADERHRARQRDRLREIWPALTDAAIAAAGPESRAAAFDALAVQSWLDASSQFGAQALPGDDEARLLLLIGAARVNESYALLFAQRAEAAREALDAAVAVLVDLNLEAGEQLRRPRDSASPPVRPGQPIGPDGAWAARYEEARRDTDQRHERIAELASTAGTDLGPIDAEALVREVYRGVPQDIREQAQSVLVRRFSTGPTVAMELIDQFPDITRNPNASAFIAELTGAVLPAPGAKEWPVEARLALINHALKLHRGGESNVDALARELAGIYADRVAVLQGDADAGPRSLSPGEAASLLAEEQRAIAAGLMTSSPVPEDLAGLYRRRMARLNLVEGPVQQFVAEQISALELLAYTTAAQLPALREPIAALVRQASSRRVGLAHVLDQAVETERAMIELNRLRLEKLTAQPPAKTGGGP